MEFCLTQMLSYIEVFSLLPLYVQYNPNDRCLFLLKNFFRHCRINKGSDISIFIQAS